MQRGRGLGRRELGIVLAILILLARVVGVIIIVMGRWGGRLASAANLPLLRLGPRAQLLFDRLHQRAVIIELAHVAAYA